MNIRAIWFLFARQFHRIPAHAVRCSAVVAVLVALATVGVAQTAPANTFSNVTERQKPFTISQDIRFDPAAQGPLLQVSSTTYWPLGQVNTPPDAASVAAHADKLNLRVVPVGSLTVLAPSSMYVIEENPGKPDPYNGLPPEERLKVLMAMFTSDQWRKAGSADGISAGISMTRSAASSSVYCRRRWWCSASS